MNRLSFIELSDRELKHVRGGDLCIVGYEQVDEDGDGQPDYLVPIYAECFGTASGTSQELGRD